MFDPYNDQITEVEELKSKDFHKVADTLEAYQKSFPRPIAVMMAKARVYEDEICGTVGCLGGHYLLAAAKPEGRELHGRLWHRNSPLHRQPEVIDWGKGARLLAQHLGFDDNYHMADFMKVHEGFWGNPRGDKCFIMIEAYEPHLEVDDMFDDEDGVGDDLRSQVTYRGLQPFIDKFRELAKKLEDNGQ